MHIWIEWDKWNIRFSNEFRFCFHHNDGRLWVWKRPSEHDLEFIVREVTRFGKSFIIIWAGIIIIYSVLSTNADIACWIPARAKAQCLLQYPSLTPCIRSSCPAESLFHVLSIRSHVETPKGVSRLCFDRITSEILPSTGWFTKRLNSSISAEMKAI